MSDVANGQNIGATAAVPHVHKVALTSPTRYWIEEPSKNVRLHSFERAEDIRDAIPGTYESIGSELGGLRLDVFPNGKFRVNNSCDICGTTTIGRGDWVVAEGRLQVTLDKDVDPRKSDTLRELFGDPGRLAIFVTMKDGHVADTVLVAQNKLGDQAIAMWNYLIRTRTAADSAQ